MLVMLVLGSFCLSFAQAAPLGTAFTYQGRLTDGVSPANGNYDFEFRLFDVSSGSTALATVALNDIPVSQGLFTVVLDFGIGRFTGDARWLEIGVRPGTSPGAFTTLGLRQALTPTPYAIYAASAPSGGGGDITAVLTGATSGLTGGATSGDVNLSVQFGVSGSASTASRSDHDHWGFSWTGNNSYYGFSVANNGAGDGIRAYSSATSYDFGAVYAINDSTGSGIYSRSTGGNGVYGLSTSGYGTGGVFGVSTASAGNGVIGEANTGSSAYGVLGRSTEGYGGFFSGSAGIWAQNTSSNRNAAYFSTASGERLAGATLYSYNSNIHGIAFYARNESSDDAAAVFSNFGTGYIIKAFGSNGGNEEFAVHNDGKVYTTGGVQVVGSGKRVVTPVLEITGGADLSENFDIRGFGKISDPSPGMVVSIDPREPGKLVVSDSAYDRKVAGIISGAGGVKPGMIMGQEGTQAHGSSPVALSGRVYCWADASKGGIEPGDLLTSSDVPGHAMKVSDYGQAQGAVIGKAMTGLEAGRGLVLVLVTLQ
jgi:hypothetical protein